MSGAQTPSPLIRPSDSGFDGAQGEASQNKDSDDWAARMLQLQRLIHGNVSGYTTAHYDKIINHVRLQYAGQMAKLLPIDLIHPNHPWKPLPSTSLVLFFPSQFRRKLSLTGGSAAKVFEPRSQNLINPAKAGRVL